MCYIIFKSQSRQILFFFFSNQVPWQFFSKTFLLCLGREKKFFPTQTQKKKAAWPRETSPHACTHTCMHTHNDARMHTRTEASRTDTCMHTHTRMHACMHTQTPTQSKAFSNFLCAHGYPITLDICVF